MADNDPSSATLNIPPPDPPPPPADPTPQPASRPSPPPETPAAPKLNPDSPALEQAPIVPAAADVPTNSVLEPMAVDAPPSTDAQAALQERPLNVTDALSYLDAVKLQFSDNPDIYNKFLDIMKDFKSQLIDTPGVIERVSNLFHGHPSLIQGFNTFLPAGYRIDTNDNPDPNYITVTTPAGITTQATNRAFNLPPEVPPVENQTPAPPADLTPDPDMFEAGVDLSPALAYVTKVKMRYSLHPDVYQKFLSILSATSASSISPGNVKGMESWSVAFLSAKCPTRQDVRNIGELLRDAPDLMRGFVEFLPDEQLRRDELARLTKLEEEIRKSEARAPKRKADADKASGLPQKRRRKPVEREEKKEPPPKATKRSRVQASSEGPSPSLRERQAAVPASPMRHPAQGYHPQQQIYEFAPEMRSQVLDPNDDAHFFERVKRAIDNRETYNEFLKLVNLFTQDIINTTRLIRESRTFLGDGELMSQFKEILGWDERKERMAAAEEVWTRPMGVLDRPTRDQLHMRYGSYRKLPAQEVNVVCSGRDDMCRSVLNDQWVSMPTFASEDSGFVAHRKNVYEDALHRSEEERHEYDFHIEAIHRTIQMLEPLNSKIGQLGPEERASFKLKPNLGGAGKAIHQRVIKKIYGKDVGLEVFHAMQETPALAIPVVLTRLKQKHEEWKRAQREWNKVWREVDARNYHKALDHQAVTFKTADKKAITQKTLVNQVEAARDEQRVQRASLIDPLFARTRPRHHLEYVVEDVGVLQDSLKLTLAFLDRTQGQLQLTDRKKIETFLRSFVPLFFMLDPVAFNASFVPHREIVDSDLDVESTADDVEMNGASTSRSGRNARKSAAASAGDLRKRLLKSEQAKSSRRTRAQEVGATPTPSRFASPALSDPMQVDGEDGSGRASSSSGSEKATARRRGSFFTNTAFYVMFRLLELLYSRLILFKNMFEWLANTGEGHAPSPPSMKLGIVDDLAKLGDRLNHAGHYYDLMLESCEKLFDNELEQHTFEEMMRYMFGTEHAYKLFTVDKVIGALIKQVQVILSDQKSQELCDLLRRERDIVSPTTQDLINCRRNTERIIGPDENLFRLDWLPEAKLVTIQLLGKDDGINDDMEVLTGRWQAYIESFVSHHYTAGVPTSSTIRRPFLRRTKVPAPSGGMPDVIGRGGLEMKVCVRTYRLFFVSKSEDVMFRRSSLEERTSIRKLVDARDAKRRKWLDDFASKQDADAPAPAATAPMAIDDAPLEPAKPADPDVVPSAPSEERVFSPVVATSPPKSVVASPPKSAVASPPKLVASPPKPAVASPPKSAVASPPKQVMGSPVAKDASPVVKKTAISAPAPTEASSPVATKAPPPPEPMPAVSTVSDAPVPATIPTPDAPTTAAPPSTLPAPPAEPKSPPPPSEPAPAVEPPVPSS